MVYSSASGTRRRAGKTGHLFSSEPTATVVHEHSVRIANVYVQNRSIAPYRDTCSFMRQKWARFRSAGDGYAATRSRREARITRSSKKRELEAHTFSYSYAIAVHRGWQNSRAIGNARIRMLFSPSTECVLFSHWFVTTEHGPLLHLFQERFHPNRLTNSVLKRPG